MAVFIKKVDPTTIEKEAHFQHCAWLYKFAPKIYKTTDDEIHMEDLQEMCLADMYGDDPDAIPTHIWESIRTILQTLYYEECIEYVDITPYNFIEKNGKVYIIDFGHAEFTMRRPKMNWFVKEFLDGKNGWNPDFK